MTSAATKVLGVVILVLLPGCARLNELFEKKPDVVVSDFCLHDSILRPSPKDTPKTLRAIAAHNAKYRALCGGNGNAASAGK